MFTKKLAIVMCFLLTTMSSKSAVVSTSNILAANKRDRDAAVTVQETQYESKVGWNLARCLLSACSIFIGTVQEVIGAEEQGTSADSASSPYLTANVTVNEWVYGAPDQWEYQIQLDHVPFQVSQGYEPLNNDAWSRVRLEAGKRLLIVFYPTKSVSKENHEILKKIDRYGVVVSNERLFSAIQDTVNNHSRYVNRPEDMLEAANLLNRRSNNLLSGYLVSYLYLNRGEENLNTEAIVISRLIGNRHVPEGYWHLLESPLVRALTNSDYPVSEAVRNQVTENLITAGISDDPAQARSALSVLVTLSDSEHVNIKPLLTPDRSRRLIRNYRKLKSQMPAGKAQAAFESQLRLRSQ